MNNTIITACKPIAHRAESVDVVLDATRNFDQQLSQDRLFGWHAALFATGYSGRVRISVAVWRTDASGPMQVVSGAVGREKVHFTAPPASELPLHTAAFLQWFNAAPKGDALIKAGLAHLWLVTLHPFDAQTPVWQAYWAKRNSGSAGQVHP